MTATFAVKCLENPTFNYCFLLGKKKSNQLGLLQNSNKNPVYNGRVDNIKFKVYLFTFQAKLNVNFSS